MTKYHDDIMAEFDKVMQEADKAFKQMEKRMEEAFESVQAEQEPKQWKEWFAWHPVKVKDKRVWLKNVYRRKTNTYVNHDDWAQYEYGTIFDAIKDAK